MPLTMPDALRLHGRFLVDAPAIVGDGSLSYGELDHHVGGVANWAVANSLNGRRVAVMLPPTAAHFVTLLGLLGSGAIVCPINTRLPADVVDRYLAIIQPSVLITDRTRGRSGEMIVATGSGQPLASQLPSADGPDRRPVLQEDAAAIVFPTGGTTGNPKAAQWTHRSLALAVQSSVQHLEVRRGERELYFSPFFHLTLVTGPFTTMLAGGSVFLAGHFDEIRAADILGSQAITRLFGTPAALERLGDRVPHGGWTSVRSVVFGASRSWPDLPARLAAVFPNARLITGYGATEFGAVTRQYHDDLMHGVAGVGRPVAGVDLRAVDDEGDPVADGEVGELLVRSPWQMTGYLGSDQEQPIGPDGFVRSGDLGKIHPDGSIVLVDRRDDVIKSGGETVFPSDVERALLELPDIAEAVVFGRLDRRRGEAVEAAIVAEPETAPDPSTIRELLVATLASFQVPTRIHVVESMPLTGNHKVDRRRLAEDTA